MILTVHIHYSQRCQVCYATVWSKRSQQSTQPYYYSSWRVIDIMELNASIFKRKFHTIQSNRSPLTLDAFLFYLFNFNDLE